MLRLPALNRLTQLAQAIPARDEEPTAPFAHLVNEGIGM
jgi:hypothetical protein